MNEVKRIFSGNDGHLSLRKLAGSLLLVAGTVLLFVADKPDGTLYGLVYSLRGLGAMAIALFLFGFITSQNIKEIINAKKDA
jgi:drug/metabolite transporter (DMT)-like permease